MAKAKGSKANGKAKNHKSAKKAKVERVRLSEDQAEKYLKHYAKKHDLRGKELDHAIRHCAATRWAALERDATKHRAA